MNLRQLKKRKQEIEGGIQFLEATIDELQSALEKRMIDLHVTNGALREVKHWIETLTKEEDDAGEP